MVSTQLAHGPLFANRFWVWGLRGVRGGGKGCSFQVSHWVLGRGAEGVHSNASQQAMSVALPVETGAIPVAEGGTGGAQVGLRQNLGPDSNP